MITPDTVVAGIDPYDLSYARFVAIQQQRNSPATADAHGGYEAVGAARVSIAFALAVFQHESQMGTDPAAIVVRFQTRNPGNCRSLRPGSGAKGTVIDTPRGQFVQYQTWTDGWRDLAYRLTDPTYVYAQEGRRTIRQIVERFAPSTDSNDPDSYANAVVADMNHWIGQAMPTVDISGYVPPRIVQQWFAPNGISFLGEPMQMLGVCVHETGNPSPGAEAQQNVNYMKSAECINRLASWHATVGHDVVIETIPQTKQAFHASDGDGPGNDHYKAIEGVVCYGTDTPEFERVLQNHAWYTAKSLRDAQLPLSFMSQNPGYEAGKTVGQHHNFARDQKDCPTQYRDVPGKWARFMAFAQAFYDRNEWAQPAPQPTPKPVDAIRFAEVPWTITAGFKGYWDMLSTVHQPGSQVPASFLTFGYPRSPEFPVVIDGQPRRAQVFDNGALLWQPDQPFPFDVRPALGRQYLDVCDQGDAAGKLDLVPIGMVETVAAWRARKRVA